jgi:tripartite-type tricarboxylate transporter receptor subunit TctC
MAIDTLSREIISFVRAPETMARMNSEAVIPVGSTPDEFTAHIRRELARWAKVVKQANLRTQ